MQNYKMIRKLSTLSLILEKYPVLKLTICDLCDRVFDGILLRFKDRKTHF